MSDREGGPVGSEVERRLRNARDQIRRLEGELDLTSRGVTALALDLERSQARHRSLFQEHPDAVFALDHDARISAANVQCVALTGHPSDALGGRSLLDFIPREQRESVRALLDETLEQRTSFDFESHFVPEDSESREAHVITLPVVVEGDVDGIFAIAKDVTEKNDLERQFLQSQKMEAVGRMAGGIVHDFNNILTSIGGHVRLILEEADAASQQREDLEEVLRATDRATSLTRQLLAFSRRKPLQPRPAVLDAVVEEMRDMIERMMDDRIEMRTALAAADTRINIDPTHVQQVLMNLAVNARDAMPEGGRLTLETNVVEVGPHAAPSGSDLGPGRYATLRVRDTGVGMDPDLQRKVFDPFFTTKGPERGTGLGLSTVYGIVEQSGGGISLHSEPEEGAEFTLYFPVSPRSAVERPEESRPQTEVGRVRGSETILLVDDDASVRSVIRRILGRYGYQVIEAGTAADALESVARGHEEIELLVCDVMLPDRSGPELVDQVLELQPGLPVVFVSGYSADIMGGWRDTGTGASFLEKPFEPDALLRAVRRMLDAAAGESGSLPT